MIMIIKKTEINFIHYINKGLCRAMHEKTAVCWQGKVEQVHIIDIHVILEVGEHDRKSVLFDTKWRYFQGFIYKLKFPAINQASCLITMNSLMKNFHELYFAIDVVNTHNIIHSFVNIFTEQAILSTIFSTNFLQKSYK
jgi:hypothetical protein